MRGYFRRNQEEERYGFDGIFDKVFSKGIGGRDHQSEIRDGGKEVSGIAGGAGDMEFVAITPRVESVGDGLDGGFVGFYEKKRKEDGFHVLPQGIEHPTRSLETNLLLGKKEGWKRRSKRQGEER